MSCVTGAGVAGGLLVRGVMGLRHNGAAGTQGSVRELAGPRPALVQAAMPVPRLLVALSATGAANGSGCPSTLGTGRAGFR